MTYRNKEEMLAFLGTVESNNFLQQLEKDTKMFNKRLTNFFEDYINLNWNFESINKIYNT